MNLLIVDDHPLLRQGLRGVLKAIDPAIGVAEASDLDEALRKAEPGIYDLILLDLKLPGIEGVQTLEKLRTQRPRIPVVVISGEYSATLVRKTIECGAMGFIPKTLGSDRLIEALQRVLDGKIYLPEDSLSGLPADAARLPELTARQMDVLRGVIQGKSNKSVGRELGVSAETVKSHLAAVMRAMGAHNRTELVYIAARRGLQVG